MSAAILNGEVAKVFPAAFASRCPACGERVEKGTSMVRWEADPTGKNRAVHASCAGVAAPVAAPLTEEQPAESAESANPTGGELEVRAAARDKNCKCCGKMINRGDRVSPWQVTTVGKKIWVHEKCASVGAAPAGERAVSGLRDVIDELEQLARLAAKKEAGATAEQIAALEAKIAEMAAGAVKRIEVKLPSGEIKKVEGVTHECFEEILQLVQGREEIFIPGPAGCGKSFVAKQVADALGMKFGMISCSAGMSEGQLTGRLLPTGEAGKFEFVTTEFLRCYEEGGVFLMDELDAADPNVLLVINSALANVRLALPNRPEKPYAERHSDFVLIAAANTIGRGADRQYVGRNQLDAATLDRFRIGMVAMDYDQKVDRALCPDEVLRTNLQLIRTALRDLKSAEFVSTRFMEKAGKWLALGWTRDKIIAKLQLTWSDDLKRRVKDMTGL